jgi:hypothetical protein
MSRWLKALATVGLVELSEEERAKIAERQAARGAAAASEEDLDALLAETRAALGHTDPVDEAVAPTPTPHPPSAASAGPPPVPTASGSVTADQPLSALYEAAGVPAAPYPAERLLKVLDGLREMPPEVRKTAIIAMDAADDGWSIDDVLLDAQRKTAALNAEIGRMQQVVEAADATATAELAEQDAYLEQASASIRAQIAELESMLQDETRKVSEHKAGVRARVEHTREDAAREAARLQREIATLSQIGATFT